MTVLQSRTGIAGRYQLLDQMAAGTLGELWRAHDDSLVRAVALKRVDPALAGRPGFRELFRDHARAWASVCHPGAVLVFDFGEQADEDRAAPPTMYLVMELVEGPSLAGLLAAKGPLPPVETLDLLAQAASTLHAAHLRGLVHGDLKPSNLLLRSDHMLKVTDFGVARAVRQSGSALPGDPRFQSPEQRRGEDATAASDLFGLGMVSCLALTGELPTRRLPRSVPFEVADLVQRLLADDPDARPADASEVTAEAVALCRRLGRRTSRPPRELLGGDAVRLVGSSPLLSSTRPVPAA